MCDIFNFGFGHLSGCRSFPLAFFGADANISLGSTECRNNSDGRMPDHPDESLVQQAAEEDDVVAPSSAISPIDPPDEVVAPPPPTKTRAGRTKAPPPLVG